MGSERRPRATVVLPAVGYVVGLAVLGAVEAARGDWADLIFALAGLPAFAFGLGIVVRRNASPVGPTLMALVAVPTMVFATEGWGQTYFGLEPWPAAGLMAVVQEGTWAFLPAGLVLLCQTFPDGRLPGRSWASLPWAFLLVAILTNLATSLAPSQYAAEGGHLPGSSVAPWGVRDETAVVLGAALLLLTVVGLSAGSLVVRYRAGSEVTRLQLRWLILGAVSVPVTLAVGWALDAASVPLGLAYLGLMLSIIVVVPACVAVAVLRYDLLEVDRLLGATAALLLTSAVSAGIFAGVVAVVAQVGVRSGVGTSAAAFLTAMALLPLYRWLNRAVGRVLDRERAVMTASVRDFVLRVRDGRSGAEEVEAVLRSALDDPGLRVLLRLPGEESMTQYVDLDGRLASAEPADAEALIPLTARDASVGAIVLSRVSTRRTRRARELSVEARLPLEVSRLQLQLRGALDEVLASRARLVDEVTAERRRLERDLHDGAQQRIVAVGMRLRSVQRRHPPAEDTFVELELAVAALEATIAELRDVSRGIRPGRLDDGLPAAIRDLVSTSPIPVDVDVVDGLDVSESVATTAYFVVAESLANTYKHARAHAVQVRVSAEGDHLTVAVSDDGIGGASHGSGLSSLRDRVEALGGSVQLVSPLGAGTLVRVEL